MLNPRSNVELDELALANDRVAGWPKPVPLPDALLPVMAFDAEFLPPTIAPWVADIADRMQCPPDFVAVAAMVGLGSVLGRKVAIRPQRKTDWFEVPNLWGGVIGRPGAMKSPAFAEALRPVRRLEGQADAQNEQALRDYATVIELFKLKKEAAQDKARKALKSGLEATLAVLQEPEAPKARRYVVNDATYEKLGEILADNPNGVLAHRDELISLLKSLDREDAASARGFFLSAWDGKSGYTLTGSFEEKPESKRPAYLCWARRSRAALPSTFAWRCGGEPAMTASCSGFLCWSGPTNRPNGETATATPTAQPEKPPGARSTGLKI